MKNAIVEPTMNKSEAEGGGGVAPSEQRRSEMNEQIIEIDEDGKVHGNDLEHALASALNCFSAENPSNTPDWILAQYLLGCLAAWNQAVQQRETWYGRDARPGSISSEAAPGSDRVGPSEAVQMVQVTQPNGEPLPAPCAISGCQYALSRVGPAPSGLRAEVEKLRLNPPHRHGTLRVSAAFDLGYERALADVLSTLPEEEKA
jgi:hypothetical protein